MRLLLGAGGLVKNCKYRIKWYIKQTFLPPKEIKNQSARKSIEIKARRLTSGNGKKQETPALDIICRALASSSAAASSNSSYKSKTKVIKGSAAHSLRNKSPNIPLIQSENIKQKSPIRLNSGNSDKLEIFNCKNCHEKSSGEDLESFMKLKDCKMPEGIESVLKQECPKSAEPLQKSPVNAALKQEPKQYGESCIIKPETKEPAKAGSGVPQKQEKAKPESSQSAKPFPAGRNPCTDGKRGNAEISKGTALNQSSCPEEDMKSVPCPKPEDEAEDRCNKKVKPGRPPAKEDDPLNAANLSLESTVRNPCRNGKQGGEKTEILDLKQNSKTPKKIEKPKDMCNEQQMKESEGNDDPSKSPPESQTTKDWKQPPLPTSQFDFPLISAFPSGRNPCRDGPRGGSKEKLKVEAEESELECQAEDKKPISESEEVCQEPKKKSRAKGDLETCLTWNEMIKQSCLNKKDSKSLKKPKTKAKKISDSAKKGKTQTPKGSIGSKPPESVPTKPAKEAVKSSEKVKAASVSSQEKLKQAKASKQLKTGVQKAVSSQEISKNLESSKKLKTAAQKTVSSQEKSKNLESSRKFKTEAQKAVSKNLESSKKLKTRKAVSRQEKSKNLKASKKVKFQKCSESVLCQEKIKRVGVSKKFKAEAKKTVSSQEKSKNPEAAKKIKSEAGKDSASVCKKKKLSCEAQKASGPVSSKEKPKHSTKGDSSKDSTKSVKLQNFPVPPLKSTMMAYLDSIEPLLTDEELKKELKLIEEFERKEGPQLQELLEAAADGCSNWLTPRWTKAAYLAFQAPVTAFTSPALSFPVQKFTKCTDCLIFTARAISAICEFKALVDQNKIPVAKMGKNELDNSHFSNIFGTVRKPGRFCDTIEQCSDSDYVVVVYRNNYFELPILSSSGKVLSVSKLVDELEAIISCPLQKGDPYGLLTHDNRRNWAEVYEAMLCMPGNADTLEAIERSLFVVCLDEYVPIPKGQELTVQAHQLLHGGGIGQNSANRWMDKTIQLIVNPNGLAGFCYEQSPAECQPLAMLMDYVIEKIKCESESESAPLEQSNNGDSSNGSRYLRFYPQDECINMWLHVAMRNITKIASQLRMHVFEYKCHGRDFIGAQGLNSDSYIQMALQLAYYNMHKTLPAQYESAHLRMFVDGRTETIRSTSHQSKTFILAMKNANASEQEKLKALQIAVDFHEKLTKRALNGKGIDRHLFGLQQMAIEKGLAMPEFFSSKGYVRSVNFQLFTSQVATSNDSFMAYGPVTGDGYGCCYNPKNNKITFSISAWTSLSVNPEHYGKAIKKSLDAMRKLIVKTGGDRVGEDPCLCEPF